MLGNGQQRKSYLYVQDCIDAMLTAIENGAGDKVQHLQPRHRRILPGERLDRLDHRRTSGCDPALTYTGGERGWIGDSPFIFLDTAKMRSLGWKPKLSIREGIIRTLDYLQANPWLLEQRA